MHPEPHHPPDIGKKAVMQRALPSVILVTILIFQTACSLTAPEVSWYAIEIDGQLVGFTAFTTTPGDSASGDPTVTRSEGRMAMELLGVPLDVTITMVQRNDPVTGDALSLEVDVDTGGTSTGATFVREGGVLHHTTLPDGITREIPAGEDLIIDEERLNECLLISPGREVDRTATYRQLDAIRGEILTREYTAAGETVLVVEGTEYTCLHFRFRDLSMGTTGQMWIDSTDGFMVRTAGADGTVIYRSDRSIQTRIGRADMNRQILAETGMLIAPGSALEYMKVRVAVRSTGEVLTADDLNVPGQRFEGTVTDNLIEGIFEIEYPRYDGANAPPFPADWSDREELRPFLEPGWMIESDDPVLIKKAREITAGSRDSWEAAVRLSRWVGEEIRGALPGGSARQTYDKGSGECGAHSRLLAAFCRAVGIPARMVMGGAYTEVAGGSFGQHGWDEVWMGEAGWIPVDCTFRETDYVDSGHIRFGLLTTFNPINVEILDYRLSETDR
jgi:hypothetical protein